MLTLLTITTFIIAGIVFTTIYKMVAHKYNGYKKIYRVVWKNQESGEIGYGEWSSDRPKVLEMKKLSQAEHPNLHYRIESRIDWYECD